MDVRPQTIKFLDENIGAKLFDVDLRDICLYLTLKAITSKAKINKWDYIELKSFVQRRKPYVK